MKKVWLFTTLLCLAFSVAVLADEVITSDVEMFVVDTQELLVDEFVTIPTPGVAQYNSGYTDLATANLTVKSNVPWKLFMKTYGWTWPEGVEKSVSDYEWQLAGQGPFKSCSNSSDSEVTSGQPTGGTIVSINYRVKLNWAKDIPGNYNIIQQYTLTKDS